KPTPPPPVVAQQTLPKPSVSSDAIEIDGLILDETRSKIGRDFYELFYNRWSPPMGARDFSIIIKELPSRGIGARVAIQVNDNVVLYRFLQPRGDIVEQEANISISYVKRYLMQNENVKQDMESGDQLGSGIF
ncbi:MAG: CsgE family curli-type amyloid fiber assembly protein, partial [Bacteroidota bacterium]